jgi:hypothetical protein
VLASALAVIFGMTFAINVTMLISAACYSPREAWRRRSIVAGQCDRLSGRRQSFTGAPKAIYGIVIARCGGRVAITKKHYELTDKRFERFSNVWGEQLRRLGITSALAPPNADALKGHRSIVGVGPALGLLIAKAREVNRQIGWVSELLVPFLQANHVIKGIGGDRRCAPGVVEGNPGT